MKIGIITFHRAHNYGALLQAYALQNVIENMGHDVEIVDYYNRYLYGQYEVFRPISINPLKTLKHLAFDLCSYKKNKARHLSFDNFINAKLHLNNGSLNNYDCLISGSDQVWNRNLTQGLDDMYALNFDSGAIKISYAASVGDINVVRENIDEYTEKLRRLDSISVREDSTAVVLKDILDKKVDVNLDPTLLLSTSQWRLKISNDPIESGKYVFAYSVGRGNDLFYDATNLVAKKKNLKIVHFEKNNRINKFRGKKVSWYKAGPLEFLNLLVNSQYVITSSFHGLALSLLFHKNVLVVINNKPDRLLSLMGKVGANKMIINNIHDVEKRLLNNDAFVDWCEVDRKMKTLRKRSIDWLGQSISKGKS